MAISCCCDKTMILSLKDDIFITEDSSLVSGIPASLVADTVVVEHVVAAGNVGTAAAVVLLVAALGEESQPVAVVGRVIE